MRNNICHKIIILSLLLVWLKITTATLVREGAGNYKCIDKERDALLQFKSYIHHDPYGSLSTWTHEEKEATNDCCKWENVGCNNHSRVDTIDLGRADLEGMISPSLVNLSFLTDLFLESNSFYGTIPISIGSLTRLEHLYLGFNDFSGKIPLQFGNLTNLKELSLRYVGNCTIENLHWLSHLSKLEYLGISGIFLGKADNWVNVILSLKELSFLDLSNCDLSQVMHPYSYSSINSSPLSIVTLYLKENNLNSSMYTWLLPLTSGKLDTLDLSGNKLDYVPKYLGNLCALFYLKFKNNSMPIKFTNFLDNLSGCTSFTLTSLDATSSQITGPLSDNIQKFSSLTELHLSSNLLDGTISEKLWDLPYIQSLDLSSNYLKGDISKNIGKLKNPIYIDLSNNSLEGVLSKADMSNLSTGKIDLSFNKFSGPIPNISSGVVWLDLSENNFSGQISFLCQLENPSLTLLDLSSNSLIGEIPDCLWNFTALKVMNLGQNSLSGRLPASMKYLTSLETLYLYNNSFSGEFPLSLKNCKNLIFLELGANKFSGYVPLWIGERLSRLYAFRLASNNFFGTIPVQLCQLVNLTVLDFSINNFNGTIPSCINNLTSMVQSGYSSLQNVRYFMYSRGLDEYMYVDHVIIKWQGSAREFGKTLGLVKSIDFSSNNLTGSIPYELTDLHELLALNLSLNALVGEIPPQIGLMNHLMQLDLSRNNLSGRIPTSMSQMTLLNYLDVSSNNLSGRIPSSTQLQSFERSRYAGNPELCGLPLTKYCPGDKRVELPTINGQSKGGSEAIDDLQKWLYIGGATGFAIGFWIACSMLLLYGRGRHAFFQFMNSLEDWVYIKKMVFITKRERATHA